MGWFGIDDGDGRDETIAHARYGLDELRILRIVAEEMAELADGGVDAMFGIDEDFAGPEALRDFSAGDKLTLARGEQDQELHWLALETYRVAVVEQFEGSAVEAKIAKTIDDAGRGSQRGPPGMGKYEPVLQENVRFEKGLALYLNFTSGFTRSSLPWRSGLRLASWSAGNGVLETEHVLCPDPEST
jgi:hypothetical protein